MIPPACDHIDLGQTATHWPLQLKDGWYTITWCQRCGATRVLKDARGEEMARVLMGIANQSWRLPVNTVLVREVPTVPTVVATGRHDSRDIRLVFDPRETSFTTEKKWDDAMGCEQWIEVEPGSEDDQQCCADLFYKLAFGKESP